MACVFGNIEVVQKLLQSGAYTSAQEATGRTQTIVVRMLSLFSILRYSIALFSVHFVAFPYSQQ